MFGIGIRKKGKTEDIISQEDMTLLQKEMDRMIAGDFQYVDTSAFQNPTYGEKLNQLIDSFKKANNNYVMRLNEAMGTIGDNAHIKKILDQVESQTESIANMEDSSHSLSASIEHITSSMADIWENTHQLSEVTKNSAANIMESIQTVNDSSKKITKINQQVQQFHEKIDKINEIVTMVKEVASQSNLLALNASIEAARAGEFGRGFAVVADQVRQLSTHTSESAADVVKYVAELKQDIDVLAKSMDETTLKLSEGSQKVESSLEEIQQMNKQMTAIDTSVDSVFRDIDTQSAITLEFTSRVDEMAASYGELSRNCIESGNHYYRAGRHIDTCRSDMFRQLSNVTQQDLLLIFEMDHFILMWRVFNHAVDFEQLKITQLNNPKGCKLGKWIAEQTDDRITGSREFKELGDAHQDVHHWACESWTAKEKGDKKKALEYFEKTYQAYFTFQEKIQQMKGKLRQLGFTDETQTVVFRK